MTQNHRAIWLPGSESSGHEPYVAFQERVRATVLRALEFKPSGFSDLLGSTLNCDPLIVKSILVEEITGHRVGVFEDNRGHRFYAANGAKSHVSQFVCDRRPCGLDAKSTSGPETEFSSMSHLLTSLPEAAPVYSQWWFAPPLYPRLLRLLTTAHPAQERVAFLGSPTLGALFSQIAPGRTTVLDVDTEVLRSLSSQFGPTADVVTYDAALELCAELKGAFGLVFVDPPWGQKSLRLFVQRAAELACEDATVIISFPQALTRPGLRRELASLVEFAARVGLHLQNQMRAATEYVVPEFERRAYLNAGIELTNSWRKGDLFFFRKTLPSRHWRGASDSESPTCWWQTRFGDTRIFLRATGGKDDRSPAVLPVPGNSGFVCPTTSSRSRIMQEASVVTTQNDVGIVHNWREARDRLILANKRFQSGPEHARTYAHQESLITMAADSVSDTGNSLEMGRNG